MQNQKLPVFIFSVILVLLILIFMQLTKSGYYRGQEQFESVSDYKTNLCRNIAAHAPKAKSNEILVKCLVSEQLENKSADCASKLAGVRDLVRPCEYVTMLRACEQGQEQMQDKIAADCQTKFAALRGPGKSRQYIGAVGKCISDAKKDKVKTKQENFRGMSDRARQVRECHKKVREQNLKGWQKAKEMVKCFKSEDMTSKLQKVQECRARAKQLTGLDRAKAEVNCIRGEDFKLDRTDLGLLSQSGLQENFRPLLKADRTLLAASGYQI